ncbi:MAG TPA: efflux RND transporter periplasmic adaptor subunit [Bradyrhizobium sp.]|jgi:multidrug efflux pump subunit AcrA (membrane-fusion protein)|uniref:efflux RND transporter periplasmic adaptor subunit n=1 Tax=Bradyrhizobium sp. TaxID=376 RepID=UPI002BDA3DC0|nr:efflux RND transporter periplasmic adaptor subunit [Bradyrhizobium sp.]HTB03868.1 efflux RND transporter periplasmic adaptor subunit [Bradyrhizobium sp.]
MTLSEYTKPALTAVFLVALAAGWYWFEHRSPPEEKETQTDALVIVTKAVDACFSDVVRGTGYVVPRREAVVGVDQEGSKVSDVLVREGDMVRDDQELARLTPPPQQQQQGGGGGNNRPASPTSLRAPAPGLVTEVRTVAGAPASPQAGPMFRIAVNNELELDAEVPAFNLLKLNAGANVRISRDSAPDILGRVRLVSPQIDRATQLGHVRITLTGTAQLKPGMFARVHIDAKRSCGVAVLRSAIDHLTVQVVNGNTVETRKVRVGLVQDNMTEILEGLRVGETVVADAGSSLHDGDQIKTMFADDDRTRVR